jgi:Flp pilus assembly protein TadB
MTNATRQIEQYTNKYNTTNRLEQLVRLYVARAYCSRKPQHECKRHEQQQQQQQQQRQQRQQQQERQTRRDSMMENGKVIWLPFYCMVVGCHFIAWLLVAILLHGCCWIISCLSLSVVQLSRSCRVNSLWEATGSWYAEPRHTSDCSLLIRRVDGDG